MKKESVNVLGKLILMLLVLVVVAPQDAKADDLSELKQQVILLQQRLDQLEARQNQQGALMEKKIASAIDEKQIGGLPDSMKWVENIKWSGDFRYRHESIDDNTKAAKRNRNRIRARLKMEAKINDEWDGIFRIASGSSDSPTSTNQSLGDENSDYFSSKELWLDWAYAVYHPDWKPGLNILMGKMSNPFYRVGKNQLIFDSDLSPEGGAAVYKWDLNDQTSAQVTGGAFWLSERSTDSDTSIFGIQGLLKHKLTADRHILGGVSFYDFGNIKGKALSGIGPKGNTVNAVTAAGVTTNYYVNDYDILEGFGEYGFKLGEVPAAVYGSYVKNVAASTSEDTAWLIGAKYNKAKKPGSWELYYDYRDIEKDAVVGGLNDSDFVGGGTDGKGHVAGIKYQLAKNVQFGLKYFMNTKNDSSTGDDYKLLQADLIFKF